MSRLEMIKAAAEKVQRQKNSSFKAKVQKKSKKVVKNATASKKSVRSLDAFDEKFMYSDIETSRKVFEAEGVFDTYRETIKFDNEWN